MRIQTGSGTIPIITLIGIWSISALNALPGLAVSPILGKLSVIFPHSTELDIQMLTSLPSLLIIPFILLSGKLTERINYLKLLLVGLIIFATSGLLYLLSGQMWQLVAVSALLGVGSGLIVPLSTGLISKFFTGKYRTKQFGLSSAVTNITLVLATTLTGYLAEVQWRLPFIVYLLPIASIFLINNIEKSTELARSPRNAKQQVVNRNSANFPAVGIDIGQLLKLMAYYLLITYLVIIISFNLPFLMSEYGFDSGASGILISIFFLAITLPGLFLNKLVDFFGVRVKLYCLIMIAIGLLLIIVSRSVVIMGIGCFIAGFGYGIAQPVVYDDTSMAAVPKKVTLALAWVMAMNYVAILVCPFIVDAAQSLFHVKSQQFAFWFNLAITILAIIVVWFYYRFYCYKKQRE